MTFEKSLQSQCSTDTGARTAAPRGDIRVLCPHHHRAGAPAVEPEAGSHTLFQWHLLLSGYQCTLRLGLPRRAGLLTGVPPRLEVGMNSPGQMRTFTTAAHTEFRSP